MAKLKIAFLGTSASGKSTLAMELTASLIKQGYSAAYVVEAARHSIEKYGLLDTIYKQKLALIEQKETEKRADENYDIVISDNPPLGYMPWTYSVTDMEDDRQRSLFFGMLEEAYLSAHKYEIFFYLPYLETKQDKIRKHDEKVVLSVAQQLKALLFLFDLPFYEIKTNDQIDGEGARISEVLSVLEELECFPNLQG